MKGKQKGMLPDEETFPELNENQSAVMGEATRFDPVNPHWQRLLLVNRGYDIIHSRNGRHVYRTTPKHERQSNVIAAMDYCDNLASRLALPKDVLKLAKRMLLSLYKNQFDFRYNHANMDDWAGVIVILASQLWSSYTFKGLGYLTGLGDSFNFRLHKRMKTKVSEYLDRVYKSMDIPRLLDENDRREKVVW